MMRVDPSVPRAEKLVLVLEASGREGAGELGQPG